MDKKELQELREYCRSIDNLVKQKGPKYEYCEARYKAAKVYFEADYKGFAFHQTLEAKNEQTTLLESLQLLVLALHKHIDSHNPIHPLLGSEWLQNYTLRRSCHTPLPISIGTGWTDWELNTVPPHGAESIQ